MLVHTLARAAPGREADRAHLAPLDGFLVVAAFVVLFVLGFPVVLAIGLPCLAYVYAKDLPLDLSRSARSTRSTRSRWSRCRCSCSSAA